MKKISIFIIVITTLLVCMMSINVFAVDDDNNSNKTTAKAEASTTQAQKNNTSKTTTKKAAAKTTTAKAASTNSSLKSMTVIGVKENGETVEIALQPDFSSKNYVYDVTVPFEVVSLSIDAVPADSKASVSIADGSLKLDVGENKTYINVKAQNGTVRKYLINTTRSEEVVTTTEPTTVPTTQAATMAAATAENIAEQVAMPKSGMNKYKFLSMVLGIGGIIFIIISICLFVKNKNISEGE